MIGLPSVGIGSVQAGSESRKALLRSLKLGKGMVSEETWENLLHKDHHRILRAHFSDSQLR